MLACVRPCVRACVYRPMTTTMMMMGLFSVALCFGGCNLGRMMIDRFDHTHWKHILQCRCPVFGSFAVLSSLPSWWSDSAHGLQHPYTRCTQANT